MVSPLYINSERPKYVWFWIKHRISLGPLGNRTYSYVKHTVCFPPVLQGFWAMWPNTEQPTCTSYIMAYCNSLQTGKTAVHVEFFTTNELQFMYYHYFYGVCCIVRKAAHLKLGAHLGYDKSSRGAFNRHSKLASGRNSLAGMPAVLYILKICKIVLHAVCIFKPRLNWDYI